MTIIESTFDSYLLHISQIDFINQNFGIVRLQIDDTLSLADDDFAELEEKKLDRVKLTFKKREKLISIIFIKFNDDLIILIENVKINDNNLSNSYWLTKEWIANCCLSNLDRKSSSLYRNFPLIISFTDLSSHDSSRFFWESRSSIVTRFFLLIKLSSNLVVTSIWSHQNRILNFELIDLSTTSKINKYKRNHLDLNKSFRLNDRRTTRFEINILIKKLTIRIVSNRQMRFEIESFMHEECNDDVMK